MKKVLLQSLFFIFMLPMAFDSYGQTCTKPSAGPDVAISLPKTGVDLTDAPSGTQWLAAPTNSPVATIDATTGVVAGMTTVGSYKFILQTTGNSACADTMQVTVSDSVKYIICKGESYTLTAQPNLTNIQWQIDATGSGVYTNIPGATSADYIATTVGTYRYTATDANGCAVELCAPIVLIQCSYGSIGDFVWKDTNNNGIQDTGELGVQNVKLYLLSSTGTKLDSAITDANGKYLFDSLATGSYKVQIVLTSFPAGCAISSQINQGTNDAADNDFSTAGISQLVNINTTLSASDTLRNNLNVDAALYTPFGSIGDLVWKDTNNNGIQDSGEAGVPNVKLSLINATTGNVIKTTTTDGSGLYKFDTLLSGTYKVQIDLTSFPVGCLISTQQNKGTNDAADNDFSSAGTSQIVTINTALPTSDTLRNNPNVDAALFTPAFGAIGDFVWKDTNNNGIQDAGEPGVANVKLSLLDATTGTVIKTTTTSSTGIYKFDSLVTGTYKVQIDLTSFPAGCYISTQQNKGTNDAADNDFSSAGTSQVISINTALPTTDTLRINPNVDAALYTPFGSIGDLVWKDTNNNGIQDTGELGVPNVKLSLINATTGNVIKTTTTDASGLYKFDTLLSGTYKVQIDLTSFPVGCYISTQQNKGTNDAADNDFSSAGTSQIVTINTALTTTDTLRNNPNVDAALFTPAFGAIGDFVWKDTNNNGIQDAGEPGVANVKLSLLDATTGTVIKTTTTSSTGIYKFDSLVTGTYKVQIDLTSFPAGCYISTQQNKGTNDAADNDFSSAGTSQVISINTALPTTDTLRINPNVDAALYTPFGSIGDLVWKDTNNNGIQDTGELGVPNVKLSLINATTGNVIKTTTTDGSGIYKFDTLLSGTYKVQIDLTSFPVGCLISTQQNKGTNDAADNDFSSAGTSQIVTINTALPTSDTLRNNPNVDAALFTPAFGAIGDFVWKDTNNNGIQDAGEPGVANVKLSLLDATTGTVIKTTTTSSTGIYKFDSLVTGTYKVQIDLTSFPAGCYISTQQNKGTNDAADNDFSSAGTSQVISINIALPTTDTLRINPNVDAALYTPFGSIGDLVGRILTTTVSKILANLVCLM